MFIEAYKKPVIVTFILLAIFIIIRFIIRKLVIKLGKSNNINIARVRLINRYSTVVLAILFIFAESFVFGIDTSDIAVVFSSVFAVIGVALFAIWSILSNVTSGVIMFFSFPYKVGDKISIHDKDFPIEAIIEDIRAFQLHLRLDNGDLVTYPNNLMLQKAVTLVQKNAIDAEIKDR
ncbi:mechanosensitive ion channel [Paucihalobacter ruber]|uniref:Mechanosensitive ion channel n=1 Tax=Paucihalobacter ruber TaxID=2567861 RepID=A0A506PIX7_9FLAO|nr:mechanosensitive ion channel [Paucihalobacter ruber]